jgi:hypothetical protein
VRVAKVLADGGTRARDVAGGEKIEQGAAQDG